MGRQVPAIRSTAYSSWDRPSSAKGVQFYSNKPLVLISTKDVGRNCVDWSLPTKDRYSIGKQKGLSVGRFGSKKSQRESIVGRSLLIPAQDAHHNEMMSPAVTE